METPSAGEVGGMFAGAVALVIAAGHGFRWLLGWEERRDKARTQKLDAWQKQLDEREQRIDAEIAAQHRETQNELKALKALHQQSARENAALFNGYQLLHTRLRFCDPTDPALNMADELLRAVFPPDPNVPEDLTSLVRRVDDALEGEHP